MSFLNDAKAAATMTSCRNSSVGRNLPADTGAAGIETMAANMLKSAPTAKPAAAEVTETYSEGASRRTPRWPAPAP